MKELHPLEFFLPENAKVLILGSFPPPRERWSMEFFYPNFINDMWRVFGLIFFSDAGYFVDFQAKKFKEEILREFLAQKGVALGDAAIEVERLKGNASDNFLKICRTVDLSDVLAKIPDCQAVVSTGGKSFETLAENFNILKKIKIGEFAEISVSGKEIQLFRMPSTSRAYPMKLEKKAEFYRAMFSQIGIL